MKAIVTVVGKDKVGIIAKVSGLLSEMNVNVEDISQTILQEYFTMFMLVEVPEKANMRAISEKLEKLGSEMNINIRIQREDVFNAMHRI